MTVFLKNLLEEIIKPNLLDMGFKNESFEERVKNLLEDNRKIAGKGTSLPIYIPVIADQGGVIGSKSACVWSDKPIDFPLYGDLEKGKVEQLILGNRFPFIFKNSEFVQLNPAFRIALIIHYILQHVVITPLAAEAFALGVYDEIPFKDEHYENTGLPSTKLVHCVSESGTNKKWLLMSPNEWSCAHMVSASYTGWTIRIRGAAPKEGLLRQAWHNLRNMHSDETFDGITLEGEPIAYLKDDTCCNRKRRAGSPSVDRMVQWVEAHKNNGTFPMRGSRNDWKTAHAMMEIEVPELCGRWTYDSMGRTYKRRKKDQSARQGL